MSSKTNKLEKRIYLKKENRFYKLIHFELRLKGDGSFYFSFKGKGNYTSFTKVDLEGSRSSIEKPEQKIHFKTSYHSSGRVNYHGVDEVRFFEPIAHITKINPFFSVMFTSVDHLKEISEQNLKDGRAVLECDNLEGEAWLDLCLAPIDFDVPLTHGVVCDLTHWLKLAISLAHIPNEISKNITDSVGLGMQIPTNGFFTEQVINKEQAKADFLQKMDE